MRIKLSLIIASLILSTTAHTRSDILIEAESFANKGGWKVDQQFTDIMGSPYLLAHGMGKPVANAKTTVSFHKKGTYHLWVRTKNWVPGKWDAPGRFKVVVNGKTLKTEFGTKPGWTWQAGGTVEIDSQKAEIELEDLTGFDGRCDALYFTQDDKAVPPNDLKTMGSWRNKLLGLAQPSEESFDVVIVGGGIAGCAAVLAADKQGLKVALIHDRPLLGGNASSEVRVHTIGIHGKGQNILKGLDTKHWPNGSAKAIPDTEKRHKTMDSAKSVHQFLSWRASASNTKGSKIPSVDAKHIETGEIKRFVAPVFIDCTGDGWIGFWAGAEYSYGREDFKKYGEEWRMHGDKWAPKKKDNLTMGTSLLWNSEKVNEMVKFPEVPWAMDIAKNHAATAGEWYWEYTAADKHQIDDAEEIRDHMLRAIYGSFFNAKKNLKNADIALKWVGYVSGKRESRRLIGDHIYTQVDVLSRHFFKDTVAEEKREIDLHYQQEEGGFLSKALFRKTGGTYYIPFRSLYSRNITNLMMAGRCFSCSHVGLGGPRVMKTTGQMGIATGYAAALCKKYNTTPRGIYKDHIQELQELIGYNLNNFNKNDLISLHYDHAPDKDDGHSAVADRTILESMFGTDWIKKHAVPVSGTYGKNAKTFNPKSDLVMDATWNDCGGWLAGHTEHKQTVDKLTALWIDTLKDNGDIWVKEGGQSDITAEVVKKIKVQLPDIDTTKRIHTVQHSDWNENKTTDSALAYTKKHTDYIRIKDANRYLNLKGGNDAFEKAALKHKTFGPMWKTAFDYYNPGNRIDFSDTGELMYILGLGEMGIKEFQKNFLENK